MTSDSAYISLAFHFKIRCISTKGHKIGSIVDSSTTIDDIFSA